jgi:hypothetical protein
LEGQSAFFERCAALERATVSQLSALLRKYRLTPRTFPRKRRNDHPADDRVSAETRGETRAFALA